MTVREVLPIYQVCIENPSEAFKLTPFVLLFGSPESRIERLEMSAVDLYTGKSVRNEVERWHRELSEDSSGGDRRLIIKRPRNEPLHPSWARHCLRLAATPRAGAGAALN